MSPRGETGERGVKNGWKIKEKLVYSHMYYRT
jgi:hypothetical protein